MGMFVMRAKALFFLTLVMGILFSHAAHATVGPPPPPPASYLGESETIFSLGIQFDFGDMAPEIVAAVRHTKTDTKNDVKGGKLDVTIPILGDDNFVPTVRVMGLVGKPDFQGEAGLGFDFASQQPLLGVGVQAPYSNGGFDLQLDGELHPFIGVNSYDGAAERHLVISPP
jgi:hypothetical protein